MNKALKKYSCHYRDTRFAKLAIARIMELRKAIAYSAAMHGVSMATHIRNSIAATPEQLIRKKMAFAECLVNTARAAAAAAQSIPCPKWYKKAP